MTVRIETVDALEVLDSRGRPTVKARVSLSDGSLAAAAVPSGASTGAFEAHELRDGDPARYGGLGVGKAVDNVRTVLAPALRGWDPYDQQGLDAELVRLDGSADKSRLGANALLAVSLATALACARRESLPPFRYLNQLLGEDEIAPALPLPMINLFSGGKHAGAQVDFQDFLVVPRGAESITRALEMTYATFYAALDLLKAEHAYQPLVADEGGLAPRLESNEAMLELTVRAIEKAGLRPLEDMAIAIDVAASHFYSEGAYALAAENTRLGPDALIDRLTDWCDRYPILSIEDGLEEEDWEHWTLLNERIGARCQVLGDDFFVTNPARIQHGIAAKAANAVLIKVNQIGTLSEALEAVRLARSAGWTTVISARSGETEDSWLADLATGIRGGQIKVGSITRSERLAKYNRLLELIHLHPELEFDHKVLDRFTSR